MLNSIFLAAENGGANASSFAPIAIQVVIAIGFVAIIMIASHLLGPKRRTHDKLTPKAVVTCATTGETHLFHHAYVSEGNLYRHGKMVIENYTSVA